MDKPTCESCPYYLWVLTNGELTFGECRIKSTPRQTSSEKWCGEHPDFPKWIERQRTLAPPPPGLAPGQVAYWDHVKGRYVPDDPQDCTTPPE